MLTHLAISHLVLIDALDIELPSGLTVLTGETGAGKSILLDGIGLALGKRAEARMVRSGEDKATVSATFDISALPNVQAMLDEQEIEHEGELIIRRTVTADGRSKAFANDTPVGVQLLAQLGAELMEVHGQHDQRGLLDPSTHLSLLDAYIADPALVAQVADTYGTWRAAVKDYEALLATVEAAKKEEDYIRHNAAELKALDPQPGEEDELASKRAQLQHQEKITETVTEALQCLTGEADISAQLGQAERAIARLPESVAASISTATNALDRAHVEMQEAIAQLEELANAEFSVRELEDAEERLFALKDAARKHRCTVDELPAKCAELLEQLEALDTNDEKLKEAQAQIDSTLSAFLAVAKNLSSKRVAAAKQLESDIAKELAGLKMEKAQIVAQVTTSDDESDWHSGGLDRAQFVASTNPGSKPDALHKIASGGELSRFMLACKMALAGTHGVPSMIFDEIDTGVGGAVADKIGSRLKALSAHRQVFCVTHLPQVAAYGSAHLLVQKDQGASSTSTQVRTLAPEEREAEIARMLAGQQISGEATAAAKKLLEEAA